MTLGRAGKRDDVPHAAGGPDALVRYYVKKAVALLGDSLENPVGQSFNQVGWP